ncbi:MAG: hypothetical protein NVSMB56_11460 [Pyrinomonadaceae bacterium]
MIVWLWLFPLIYVLHISEEYWGGGGYSNYMSRKGVAISPTHFLIMTGFGCVLVIIAIVLALKFRKFRWTPIILASVFCANGVSHLLGGVRTGAYNPGLISGLLVWIPFGAITLVRMKRDTTRHTYWIAVVVGIGIQLIVSLLALNSGKLFGA